ncbi:hypothetical protein OCS_01806 [Ophiocordyceps sinensis CO18]|uniref:Uncharacterized protein n=1 Tax=Ophiocordyceps sinensis (strain Co18 / CGMCC 3.14243) TaxID=911162 RepID=T5AAI7_OPHSC|nr:hypothetical protein OCS_01806 [Ophiocordyceps sinensis CO18]
MFPLLICGCYQDNTTNLQGSVIWLSGEESKGFDVVLSPDLRSEVQGIFDNRCKDGGSSCHQAIYDALRSAGLEVDKTLDKRFVGRFILKTFKKLGGFFMEMTVLLTAMWEMRQTTQPQLNQGNYHIPAEQASAAHGIADASTITVTAANTALVTVTVEADAGSTMGFSATPTLISYATATDGILPGDYILSLDAGLAQRISDVMARTSSDCSEGVEFGRNTKRAVGGGLSAAICGTVAILHQHPPRGPFGDLGQLAATGPPLRFNGAEMVRAANILLDIGRDLAPLLEMDVDFAEQFTMIIFAMAVEKFVDNVTPGALNWFHGSSLAACSSTTTARACVASCRQYGVIEACETSCKKRTLCATAAPTSTQDFLSTTTVQYWTWPLIDAMPTATAEPECNRDLTNVPGNIFNKNLYKGFCEQWNGTHSLEMTVDAAGNERHSNARRNAALEPRTPPPDPDTWKAYNFLLKYTKADQEKCSMSCTDAMGRISSGCSNSGAVDQAMAHDGKVDATCGIFEYSISKFEPPAVDAHAKQVYCNTKADFTGDDFDNLADTDGDLLDTAVKAGCKQHAQTTVSKDKPVSFNRYKWTGKALVYALGVSWKEGCRLEDGRTEVTLGNPYGGDFDESLCYNLWYNNWKGCNNGGKGGTTQVGCLVYSFRPSRWSPQ